MGRGIYLLGTSVINSLGIFDTFLKFRVILMLNISAQALMISYFKVWALLIFWELSVFLIFLSGG